jgi:PAS domain S-box-containing protein
MAALPSSSMNAHILNVDDNEPSRYVITRILKQARFEVSEAGTGMETLRLVDELQPDIVLLDVHLPDINGIEVCRRIKANPKTARIPVLQLSATYVSGSDRARALEGGAESYLVEPVEPEVLIATINALLRGRQADAAMREMAVQWQSTFDAITDGVALLDPHGVILRCNRAMEQLFSRIGPELLGHSCVELWDPAELSSEGLAFHKMLRTNRREEMDVKQGKRWFRVTADPVRSARSSPTGAVYIVSDITERKRLEDKIRQAQKYESIGHLAGGVAHDFNNLLTSILGNTSLLLGDLSPGDPRRERLNEIERASYRAADLTQQLLAYSGRGRFVMRKVHLSSLVDNMSELIRAAISKKIDLVLDLGSGVPPVEADPRQMRQLVMNLVMNAAEAIGEESGAIRIATGIEHVEQSCSADLSGGPHVFLEVRDTGCGMDERTQSQIFDPFFSTKFAGRGLGLSAVAGIARGHHGAIRVHSAPGQGSAFRVLFPAMETAAREAVGGPTESLRGAGTILVVDDEEMIRRFAANTLKNHGYEVIQASNGREALEIVRARGGEISAVLLDMTMPVMDGEEALRHISKLRPRLKVIVSTGYEKEQARERFARSEVHDFLSKPYSARQLAEKVKAVVSPEAGAAGRY